MSDPRMPKEMIDWMDARGWGEHHEQWHLERQWDLWTDRAAKGDAGATQVVAYMRQKGMTRAPVQEGQPGNGMEFLAMHRAMILLLTEAFPQHAAYLAGWGTPPQDPQDPNDPVPDQAPFAADMAAAVEAIEGRPEMFETDDAFGLFVETRARPTAADPRARSADPRAGIHNWLHNRWTDTESDVNLGDPLVNLGNARFWRLHGWIDAQWSRFRAAKGLSDTAPDYQRAIALHRTMMSHPGHVHVMARRLDHGAAEPPGAAGPVGRPAALSRFFAPAAEPVG